MDRQPHRIVVEGMDGSGKTTLIRSIKKEFPQLEVIRRPPMVAFDDWWPEEMERQADEPIPLHDRFFYSELVYGPILRGKIDANMELVNNVAWFLRSVALLIYVRPHSDVLRTSVSKLPQMDGVHEKFYALLEAYDNTMAIEMQWYGDRFHRYDWSTGGARFTTLFNKISDYLG